MEVSAQSAPAARRWAQNLSLVLAYLTLLGIFLQGFVIGAFLFGGATWGQLMHAIIGLVLMILSLLLALVGLLAQLPGGMKWWVWLLFVLMVVQSFLPSANGVLSLLAALHPANAMLLFGLNLFLIVRIRQVMRANN